MADVLREGNRVTFVQLLARQLDAAVEPVGLHVEAPRPLPALEDAARADEVAVDQAAREAAGGACLGSEKALGLSPTGCRPADARRLRACGRGRSEKDEEDQGPRHPQIVSRVATGGLSPSGEPSAAAQSRVALSARIRAAAFRSPP
ncbi:MAG TPA: hypothetical protein VLI67_03355, partial [Vicinamibacteria bacterium]|nr:hypothetical protein [Vicinamibacteria bacterium]